MELPSVYYAADTASVKAQNRTRRFMAGELGLFVAAAVSELFTWHIGDGRIDLLAGIATAAFLTALVVGLSRAGLRPEDHWYRARAAAESTKSLAWLYAVGGDPFPLVDAASANERFIERTRGLLGTLGEVELESVTDTQHQLTEEMSATRAMSLAERILLYQEQRIDDQIAWYTARAHRHRVNAIRCTWVLVLANVVGVSGGIVRFLGIADIHLLAVGATLASATIAWAQLYQYHSSVAAYQLTVQELLLVRDSLGQVRDEQGWAKVAGAAETAISREHTMWLARRGLLPTG